MTKEEIIGGLKFTVDMFLLDPSTGETYTEPRNDMDKTTIDACKGAVELLEQTRWIPVSERLPEVEGDYLTTVKGIVSIRHEILSFSKNLHKVDKYDFPGRERPGWYFLDREYGYIEEMDVIAWMPLPELYKAESTDLIGDSNDGRIF